MYTNHELMYQLQKFEEKLNQHPKTLNDAQVSYQAGYESESNMGPYYYVNEIIETNNGSRSEHFLVTIEQNSGYVVVDNYFEPTQLQLIADFANKLTRHDMLNNQVKRPSIELHPTMGEYDADSLHP